MINITKYYFPVYQFASCVPVNGLAAFATAGGLYVLEAFTPVVVTPFPHQKFTTW